MDAPATLWSDDFRPYTALHAATTAACAVFIVGLCWLGARLRRASERRERRLRFAWAGLLAASHVAVTAYWLMPERFDVRISLPLHVCDLAGLLSPFALVLNVRLLRALLYFWGLGLSSWAYIAPVLTQGPAHSEFWVFWIGHTQIVGSAVYLVWVCGYRPSRRDALLVTGLLLVYGLAMTALNSALGLNYGFLGPTPDRSTPLDLLGPWPLRVPVILAGEAALIALFWAPWALARRRRAARHGAHSGKA